MSRNNIRGLGEIKMEKTNIRLKKLSFLLRHDNSYPFDAHG